MKNADRTAAPNRSQSPDNPFGGLTKREMFAMNAMQALIPVYWEQETLHDYGAASDLVKCMMETAVEHADALLAELDK
jgi:hypothetical protein